jgi:hypothetical protein
MDHGRRQAQAVVRGTIAGRTAGMECIRWCAERMTKPDQRWRPINLLPAFKYAVSSAAQSAREQARNMREAVSQPGLINRIELARMQLVYQDTALYVEMCGEQLRRWRGECTTSDQAAQIDLLDEVVRQWADDTQTVIDAIKALMHDTRNPRA